MGPGLPLPDQQQGRPQSSRAGRALRFFGALWSFPPLFGERITRDQAVRELGILRHADSIADFIGELSRLVWMAGHEAEVVEDKLTRSLNNDMALERARVARKPQDIREQLAMIRDIGHALEDHCRSIKPKGQGGENGSQSQSQGGRLQGKEEGAKGKGKEKELKDNQGGQQKGGKTKKSGEWKDRNEELRGIPKDILEERRKEDKCQKCGKGSHK